MGEEKTAPELVWSRERREPRRQALNVERIVTVSIGIADTEGLDALTMRRVATDLDSGTTSLYRYVAGRDELLDLMIDATQGEDVPAPLSGDWRADVKEVARRQRAVLLRHPWLGSVMVTRPALGPNSLRQMDIAIAAAGGLTSDITLAADVISLVSDYVLGAVSREVAEQETRRRTGMTEEQWRASVAPYIREVVESGAYPRFARWVVEAEDRTFEERFEFGLDCIFDGIARRLRDGDPGS
ncbi:TetR/AcrR family transcriptional regulator [Streptosporangium sp. NPDC000396]|uniref:TetR/AcrR family transcriptional regulator n=1 Tax=Streptosporangium sp. NPDC000396 TaxID=3366185 RepID=UPI0036909F5D